MGTLPCFRLMKSGIRSIGPGLYSAMMAIMSSKRSGLKPASKSRIPELSSWKIPVVFPEESKAKVLASSKGNRSTLNGGCPGWLSLIRVSARRIIVSVLRPRKSNFTNPIFSTSPIEYWVTISSLAPL